MAKQLVALLLFASQAVCLSAKAMENAPVMQQSELLEPATVAAWLKENASKADKVASKTFFDAGVKQRKQRRLGPAVKSFGASALYYPTPHALNQYAAVTLVALGELRRRDGDARSSEVRDLGYVERLYRSVLAADLVLHTMTAEERQKARENAECLAIYVQDRPALVTCEPLRLYLGMESVAPTAKP